MIEEGRSSSRFVFENALLGAVVMLALLMAGGIWTYLRTIDLIHEERTRAMLGFADGLAAALADSTVTRDYGSLESRLRQILADRSLESALIADTDGRVLAHLRRTTGDPEVAPVYGEAALSLPSGGGDGVREPGESGRQVIWRRILAGRPVGWLRLEVTDSRTDQILHKLRRDTILAAAVAAFAVILVVAGILLRIHRQVRRDEAEMLERQALLEIMEGLASTPDPREFLKLVHGSLKRVLHAESFFALIQDPGTGLFERLYAVDQHDELSSRVELGRGLAAYVFRTGEALVVTPELFAELERRGEVASVGTPSLSWLGAPLKKGARTVGVMAVQDYETRGSYSEHDRAFLSSVAAQVGLAVERQQAEEAMRESESRYRLVTENAGDVIWTIDAASGTFTFLSPAVKKMLGYRPEELLGRPATDFLAPSSVGAAKTANAEGMPSTGLPPRVFELDQVHKDGSVVHAEIVGSSATDDSGRLQFVGVTRDITDRKRAEREREALLAIGQAATAATDTGEFLARVHEALRRVLRANSFFVVLQNPGTGLLEEVYRFDERAPGPHEPAGLPHGRAAYVLRTGEATLFTPALFEELRSRGEVEDVGPPPASWLGVPLRSGSRVIGVLSLQDFDVAGCYSERDRDFLASAATQVALAIERQKSRQILLENEARLREAQRMAHVGVWEMDIRRNRLSLSDEGYRILGLEPRGEGADPALILAAIHPEDRKRVRRAYLESLSTDGAQELDHRLLLPDGSVRWVKERWRSELGEDGAAIRITGTFQDLTEQLLAREAKSLAEAKEAAEAANRAKSVFLASMSHEIRTPMNAILGFSQLLLDDAGLLPRQRGQLESINRSGEHLLSLINDVLEMSKIEAGRVTVNIAETDLASLVWDIESMFRLRADEKSLLLTVERAAGLPRHVMTDETKLRQILINLIGNAVKFTAKGGVGIRLRAEPGQGAGPRLVVEVEDSGPGIAAEELPRLFQRFEQTRTGRETRTGTGLGLVISQGFARLMGGDITVESRLGAGSVFRLSLPVTLPASPGGAAWAEPRRVVGLPPGETRRRVLVADDISENREILCQMLSRVGFEVRTANDGLLALELFSAWHPDLVLMDLRMPGMDGLSTIRAIRAAEKGGRVPIVAVTASAFEDDRRDVEAAGGDGFVSKPFREVELLRAVSRCLGVRFVVEGEPVAGAGAGAGPSERTPSPADAIPGPLREALREAVVRADLDRVHALTEELSRIDPGAAQVLRDLAERFEYERLVAYLGEPG